MHIIRLILNQLNMRARLSLMCLAVAAPLLLLGSYVIYKEYQTLSQEARRATSFQAAISVRALSHWISAQQDELAAIAALPQIQNLQPPAAQSILQTVLHAKSNWRVLALLSPQGEVLASTSKNRQALSKAIKQSRFWQDLLKGGKPAVSGYLQCPWSGHAAILAGAPVKLNGRLPSVVVASIDPKAILKIFQGLGESNGSVTTIVDEKQKVLARTLNNRHWLGRDFSQAKTVQAALKHHHGTLEVVGIADPIARAYAFDRLPATNWLVITGVPLQAIYGPGHDRILLLLLAAACAAGFSMLLAYAATGHFTRIINHLVREAVAIGRGDLSKRVEVVGNDELGLLARAFNQMANRLEFNQEHKLMVEKISESIRQSLDLNCILNTTVSELGQALEASRCCLALIDARSHNDLLDENLTFDYVFWSEEFGGTPLKNRRMVITENSMLKTILQQGSILSMDVLNDTAINTLLPDSYPEDWHSIKSLLACPISTRQRPLGLILVHQCREHRVWSDAELELVEAIARHVALAMEQANLYAQTKALAEQELLINHIVKSMRSSLDPDTILNTVSRELGQALAADRCQIAQFNADGQLLVTHEFQQNNLPSMLGHSFAENGFMPPDRTVSYSLPDMESNPRRSLQATSPASGNDSCTQAYWSFLIDNGTQTLLAAPLIDNQRLLGLLIVHRQLPHTWDSTETGLLTAIADQVAVAISHARLFAQVRHQAITDGLTELYNHVYLKKRLADELRRCQRRDTACSLLMVDLDKLKQINDTYGHPIGDIAIRQVARTLKTVLRSGDTAARYGGEEFAVILPDTPLPAAAAIAERLCRQVNAVNIPDLGRISVSIGVATYPTQASNLEELVEKADQALYQAKHSGRNQVRLCPSQQLSVPLNFATNYDDQYATPGSV